MDSIVRGEYTAGLYTAPDALFKVKSPLGPDTLFFDSFDRSTGAVTFLDNTGKLFGVICTPSYDVLAGAKNDFETDAAILRNWLHDATFPLFFKRQLPGAVILNEGPAKFAGKPAWIAMMHLPKGSSMIKNDPATGKPTRQDSWRGLVVFSRGEHTYLIMTEAVPDLDWNTFLPKLSDFYHGITFTALEKAEPESANTATQHAGT